MCPQHKMEEKPKGSTTNTPRPNPQHSTLISISISTHQTVNMGNCCGGDDYPGTGQYAASENHTSSGVPPPPKMMTPDEDKRREQTLKAAEERARQNAVRGTQRYTYVTSLCLLSARNPLSFCVIILTSDICVFLCC